jgi:hypothetical protein
MMSCDQACSLMDEYLENRLSLRDQERIKEHVVRCPRCRQELEGRQAFDHQLRYRLSASVSGLQLSREAGHRIVQAAERSARRALWSRWLIAGGQIALGLAMVIALMVGLIYALGRVPTPLEEAQVEVAAPEDTGALQQQDSIWFEPTPLRAGDPFSVTLRLRNQTNHPLSEGVVTLSLKRVVGGGSGYRFSIPVDVSLGPGEGGEVQLTPRDLRPVCLQVYQIEPRDLLAEPGVYSYRVTYRPGLP